ncbi:hypothetical protein IGI37_002802 [Enterococcus sp. AZ194]|uniref:alpha/beta fold hydrolase n=1 Tax=Enterococcus sp. AZ194 TaxID=2774629 RepID=UPI003F2275A7
MRKNIAGLLIFMLVLLTACSAANPISSNPKKAKNVIAEVKKTAVPALFIHGYSGTKGSFGGMIHRLEETGIATKELLLTVSSTGEVTSEGTLSGNETNPIVQVLFTDNKNNEWNQAEWIRACLLYLKENFQVNQVNLVGHSMGGVSSLRYLGAYGADTRLPTIGKFVAIGSPFNDFDETPSLTILNEELTNGPTNKSARYQEYQQTIGQISTDIAVLLVAGQLSDSDLSDGTVPLGSALAVNALLTQNGNAVQTKIFEGKNAQHSQLHENKDVDQLVSNFLWSIKK